MNNSGKITVVYDKRDGKLVSGIWEKDGTFTVINKEEIDYEYIVVSLIDPRYVDFDTGRIYLKE